MHAYTEGWDNMQSIAQINNTLNTHVDVHIILLLNTTVINNHIGHPSLPIDVFNVYRKPEVHLMIFLWLNRFWKCNPTFKFQPGRLSDKKSPLWSTVRLQFDNNNLILQFLFNLLTCKVEIRTDGNRGRNIQSTNDDLFHKKRHFRLPKRSFGNTINPHSSTTNLVRQSKTLFSS